MFYTFKDISEQTDLLSHLEFTFGTHVSLTGLYVFGSLKHHAGSYIVSLNI